MSNWLSSFFSTGGKTTSEGGVPGPISSSPNAVESGSLGEPGAAWGVSPDGSYASSAAGYASDAQQVPWTGTPPYGEPPLYNENFDLNDDQVTPNPTTPPFNTAQERDAQHEWIHGTPWHGYDIQEWVNPQNPGIPNLGPVNIQPFESSHTNAMPHNASAEQGWGLDPAILYPRRPNVQNTNPYWSMTQFRRMGGLAWNVPGIPFGDVTQQRPQAYAAGRRRPSFTHNRLSDVPPNVPFSSTVPVYGNAGPIDILPEDPGGVYN